MQLASWLGTRRRVAPISIGGVLRSLQRSVGEAEARDAGYAFRGWAEVERLIIKSDERPQREQGNESIAGR
jgi:hypothetical protein